MAFYFLLFFHHATTSNTIKAIVFIFFIFSVLSKAVAVTLPVIMLLIDLYRNRKINVRCIIEKAVFLVVSGVFGVIAVKAQASDAIAKWLPGPLHSLGTFGFGRSEGRTSLRDFFEVDSKHIVYATLYSLMKEGKVKHERLEILVTQNDFERMYQLLSKKIRRNLTIEEMVAIENGGLNGFLQAFQGQGVMLGVYNHNDDVCYVLKEVPSTEIWGGHPNAFHAVFAAHELSHRYVRMKRESLGIRGIGNSFWEEKYCRFIEAGFNTYVFMEGTEKNVPWRRKQQRELGVSLFDAKIDKLATKYFIAKYRERINY